MKGWRLKCTQCGQEWLLPVSFRLADMGKIYHYCPKCAENTFHQVLERVEK